MKHIMKAGTPTCNWIDSVMSAYAIMKNEKEDLEAFNLCNCWSINYK